MNQKVDASQQSMVIQSGNNTSIGYSASDIKSIIETLGDQMPKLAAIAASVVEARLSAFEEKILIRFSDSASSEARAFSDPDFQYSLSQAQRAYCRFGEDIKIDMVIDLLAQRSKEPKRTRLSLCLSQAIERSSLLTDDELAALSLYHLIANTGFQNIDNIGSLAAKLQQFAGPLLPNISSAQTSYSYLESHGCASFQVLKGEDLITRLRTVYPGILSLGHDTARLVELFGDRYAAFIPDLITPCVNSPDKWQANAADKVNLQTKVKAAGLNDQISRFEALLDPSSLMSKEQVIDAMLPHFPKIEALFDTWDNTLVKRLRLTPVGTAIAHANLRTHAHFNSDLSTWIS